MCLNGILESDEATRLLVEVLQAAATADMAAQVEATKVKAIAIIGQVAAKLSDDSDTLDVLHKTWHGR